MDTRDEQVSNESMSVPNEYDAELNAVRQTTPRQSVAADQDYLGSFSALKDSMAQGYSLKKKRKALAEYNKTLETLKEAYRDRVHIAQNYEAVINDQKHIISATQDELDRAVKSRDKIEASIASANDALAKLKQEQAQERKPFEEELERRNAELASVKDELKQVKAQRNSLDLFDDDSKQVSESEAAHDAVVERVNEKYETAKAAQRTAQKSLDAREKKERAQQKKSLDDIKHLNAKKEEAAKRIEELEKRVTTAQERAAFCKHVIEHPEETQAMAERIAENEKTAAAMSAQISQLASAHERTKAASTKARAIVITAAIVVVVFLVVFFLVTNR